MKEILNLAPKQLIRFLTESLSYAIKSFFKYWIISSVIYCLVLYTLYRLLSEDVTTKQWILVIAGTFVIVAVLSALFRFRNERTIFSEGSFPIGITETVMIEDKANLILNTDSQKITQKLEKNINIIRTSKFPFCKGLMTIYLLKNPKIFYFSHSLDTWRITLKNQVTKSQLISILMVTRDLQNRKVDFEILYGTDLLNSDTPLTEFKKSFDGAIPDDLYEDYIVEVSRIYIAMCGQSIIDLLIGYKDLSTAHQILDDCESIIKEAFSKLEEILVDKKNKHLLTFKSNLLSNFERYRGIVFLNQEKYSGAIRHIFKAMRLHPYFPYTDYVNYKEAFNKIYVAHVNFTASDILSELSSEDGERKGSEISKSRSIELLSRTEFNGTPTFDEILIEIMGRANSKQIYQEIEEALKNNFCLEPICYLIRGEVLKYIPKGEKKHNNIYVNRIPEVLAEFEKVLQIDEDFLLIYTRLGVLKIIKSFYETNDEKSTKLIKEGTQLFTKGYDVYSRLGLH